MVNPPEGILSPPGELYYQRLCPEFFDHLLDRTEEIGPNPIHLVYKSYLRHMVFVGLMPYRFRLGLNTTHATEDGNGTV